MKASENQKFMSGDAIWRRPRLLTRKAAIVSSTLLLAISVSTPACSSKTLAELNSTSLSLIAKASADADVESADSGDNDLDSEDLKSSSQSASSKPTTESQNKPLQFKRQLIDTSIEETSAPQPAPEQSNTKSAAYLEHEARLSAPLKKLIQAPQIYDHSKGGSSEFSDAFLAAAKEGAKNREDLLFMVENGSPAGKIYAAVLLRLIDSATGTKILNGFKSDKTLVNNKSYTSVEHFTMGEIATDLLSPAPSIILKPK